jgi:YVTN family beta-propeller protein
MHSPLLIVAVCFFLLAIPANLSSSSASAELVIVNQADHSVLLVDSQTRTTLATISVGVNGHEVAVSPDSRFAYVPIYGNVGVGRPGTDGRTIDIIDLREKKLAGTIDLGKPVRPHCAKFGPDGLLYVSAELSNAIFVVDAKTRKVVGEIPTGQIESHMLVISPDGTRIYTANVHAGSISVIDVPNLSVLKIIPVAKVVQRVAISPDGRYVFTHDQESPRIAVIDTAKNEISRWLQLPASVYSSLPTPDGRWLLANSPSGKLFVWDLTAQKLSKTFDIPPAIGAMAISADGRTVYITCPQDGSVQVLNLATWKMEPHMTFTKGVDGIAVVDASPTL